jgi:hypothetical protein
MATSGRQPKQPDVKPKTLKLKAIPDASVVIDDLNRAVQLPEFEKGKEFKGSVIYSRKGCIVVQLQMGLTEAEKAAAENERNPGGESGGHGRGIGRAGG